MEYNSYNFVIILLVCDFSVALHGTCKFGYYSCDSGAQGCCPDDYVCTGYTKCSKTYYYYSSDSSSSNVGKIVGASIGGIIGLLFLIAFLIGCCEACTCPCKRTRKVQSIDTQSDGNRRTATDIRQETGGNILQNPQHTNVQPPTQTSSDPEPGYPPPSYHI
ncbi:uncharacterized protein LOC143043481 isoform X1 [Mytilus galloprovincialis]|uniref:uncharacterized protein LOC143043481 isoform X1 n=1 Tax=Mytilus galloprovincialis TaxID=29158 RepID=UPI003F7BC0FD